MSVERVAVVHDDELAAIKDSRQRDLPLFSLIRPFAVSAEEEKQPLWIVAVSEHQANLALVDYLFPIEKCAKKDRDERYTELLELAVGEIAKDEAAADQAAVDLRGVLGEAVSDLVVGG